MTSEQGLSAENRALIEREWPIKPPTGPDDQVTMRVSLLNRLLNAARSIPPVDEGVREKVARLIDPRQWLRRDAYIVMMADRQDKRGIANDRVKESLATADAILALLASPPSGWRPIEEAPKDGTAILVGHEIATFCAWWDGVAGGWVDGLTSGMDDDLIVYHPTHWQPLPPPPVSGRAKP